MFLEAQIFTHSVSGKGKGEYDTLVGLNYSSVQFLFDVFHVRDRAHTFRKLHAVCDLVHNRRGLEHFDKRKKQETEMNTFIAQLMKNKGR